MPSEVLGRSAEAELVGSVLGGTEPAALLLDGEAGIGKTTVLLSAIDRARELGFTVLFARAAVTEHQHAADGRIHRGDQQRLAHLVLRDDGREGEGWHALTRCWEGASDPPSSS